VHFFFLLVFLAEKEILYSVQCGDGRGATFYEVLKVIDHCYISKKKHQATLYVMKDPPFMLSIMIAG